MKTDDVLRVEEECLPVAFLDDKTTLMRGAINGIKVGYTIDGWLIDYSQGYVRVQIVEPTWFDMEAGDALGEILRTSRVGDSLKLKLAIGEQIEYEGDAEVQMIRFRARRTQIPNFRVQLKLSDRA